MTGGTEYIQVEITTGSVPAGFSAMDIEPTAWAAF